MITRFLFCIAALTVLVCGTVRGYSEKISRESITSQGKKRSYYLFVPASAKPSAPAIVMLHGSGHNGISVVEQWQSLAEKEGIILIGPDSNNPQVWSSPVDGPDFLHDVIEEVKTKHSIDPRRVYLFGHSGGAVFALQMSIIESEYFAATAIHAGAWRSKKEFSIIDIAKRKIPTAITVGDRDQFFPLSDVRATCDALKARGFDVELNVILGHDHNYYDLASKINPPLWAFISKQKLDADPKYEVYNFK